MQRLFISLLMVFAFLSGCAVDYNPPTGGTGHVKYAGNTGVTNFWVGRNDSKLIAVRGEPESQNTTPCNALLQSLLIFNLTLISDMATVKT